MISLDVDVLSTLDELRLRGEPMLVLYSGGVDGSYFLDWAAEEGLQVHALHIDLFDHDVSGVVQRAEALRTPIIVRHLGENFADTFIAPAIRSRCWFNGLYPISSSLSRPLLAQAAVNVAHDLGIRSIVHTSTFMQNSLYRLSNSLLTLDPGLTIGIPFAQSTITREHKLDALTQSGVSFDAGGRYSVDATPWARVIENGALEDSRNPLPDGGVFSWTQNISQVVRGPVDLVISFKAGLPIAINGEALSLFRIVMRLNEQAGQRGIGRFSGLEPLHDGLKNHEIREAPAAAVLTLAHHHLETATLTAAELSFKSGVDEALTSSAVAGDWFGILPRSARNASIELSQPITGDVRVRLDHGTITVLSVSSRFSLGYASYGQQFARQTEGHAARSALAFSSFASRLRNTRDR